MPHHTPLIATIAAAFVLALAFGFVAARLRAPPLVGYLIAGIVLGSFTPGLVADARLAAQLADVGVILLMFGVGLHFSFGDLLKMRRVALPGAIAQMAVATTIGAALAIAWGWSVGASVVFGLALSVASTVVLLQALEKRNALDSPEGHLTMGWLIVEDLAMVLVLVVLPVLANPRTDGVTAGSLAVALSFVLAKILIFGLLAMFVGRRAVPWLLMQITRTGSRELFTLAVLAIALGIAYGSAALFDVSFALGAFFAGVVLSESELSQRAAADSLPLKDAFAVLFFVSVGMLFDPSMLLRTPLELLAVLAVILLGKALTAYAIVRAFGFRPHSAFMVAASLAQIGEFSFILASLAASLGLLPTQGRDLILASAILSIALNPLAFACVRPLGRWLERGSSRADRADGSPVLASAFQYNAQRNHAVVVGYGRVGGVIGSTLENAGVPFTVVESDPHLTKALRDHGIPALRGDAMADGVLDAAGIRAARVLVLAIPDGFQARRVLELARSLNPHIQTTVRTHSESELAHLQGVRVGLAVLGEHELALAMADYALACFGLAASRRPTVTTPPSDEASRIVMSDREIVSTLNELIEVSQDGEKGFARAATDSKDPALIKAFGDSEQFCREAAEELQDEVRMLGGRAEEGGSMRAAGHRGWSNLKNVMSTRDNRVILEECEKAEEYAQSRYAAAMRLNWPASLRVVIERQYQAVIANHDRVLDLRNRYRA